MLSEGTTGKCNIIYYNVAYHTQEVFKMSTTQPIKDKERLQEFKSYYKNVKKNPRNHMLIIIGLNSALRISDLLNLTFGDFYDFDKGRWKTHIVVKEKKTGKINRIYVNGEISKIINEYIDIIQKKADDWIFESHRSTPRPLSRYQAFRIVKEAADYVGLSSEVSCHSLRKTFGYYAWKQGTPPALLMNLYNHSTYQITKRYLCIDQDDKDSVYKKIDI